MYSKTNNLINKYVESNFRHHFDKVSEHICFEICLIDMYIVQPMVTFYKSVT